MIERLDLNPVTKLFRLKSSKKNCTLCIDDSFLRVLKTLNMPFYKLRPKKVSNRIRKP